MRIAIVGCGYVADYYWITLKSYPELEVTGVFDVDTEALERFSRYYKVRPYRSLDELVLDPAVEMVINLTNPRSHFDVSHKALDAGKHVYSEKPLAMSMEEAETLLNLANEKGLRISAAPCSVLGETAQTVWHTLKAQKIGNPFLVYAELDDGLLHQMPYKMWKSQSGAPWPYKDELEIGCTLEHAGYYITWLTAFFGPARSVTAFSSCVIKDKKTDVNLSPASTPDFSVTTLSFASGVVARLTCGIVAPHDHSLKIIGETGDLHVNEGWDYRSPVYIKRRIRLRRKLFHSPIRERCPLPKNHRRSRIDSGNTPQMDFARGIFDLSCAIQNGTRGQLPEDFCLHNTEIYLAIHGASSEGIAAPLATSFAPLTPTRTSLT